MNKAVQPAEEVQKEILIAAESRFRTFGYNKTTMAEIAQDCKMSTSNLYRFFENKQDIGEGCVFRCFNELEKNLREVIHQRELTIKERLEAFILANLDHHHRQFSTYPQINELIVSMEIERKEIMRQHMERRVSILSELLSEGNRTGVLDVENVIQTSQTILHCAVKYISARYFPIVDCSMEERKEQVKDIVELLYRGMENR